MEIESYSGIKIDPTNINEFSSVSSLFKKSHFREASLWSGRRGCLAALAINVSTVDYFIIFNYSVIKPTHSARLRRRTLLACAELETASSRLCHPNKKVPLL